VAKPEVVQLSDNKERGLLIASWCAAFKQRYGVNPALTKKDHGILHSVKKSISKDNLNEILIRFFESDKIGNYPLKHEVWEFHRYKNDLLKMVANGS
jgi:hypothetical protein